MANKIKALAKRKTTGNSDSLQTGVSLAKQDVVRLDELAAQWGQSRSGMVRFLIRHGKLPELP